MRTRTAIWGTALGLALIAAYNGVAIVIRVAIVAFTALVTPDLWYLVPAGIFFAWNYLGATFDEEPPIARMGQ